MLACVQFIVRVQLVHVSVKIDHRLRVGTVHYSHTPDSGLWKVCVSVDQGLRVEVVYVSHMPHSISGKLSVRLDRGLQVARVGMVHVSHKPDSGLWKILNFKKCLQTSRKDRN